jgi:hypothetical protein
MVADIIPEPRSWKLACRTTEGGPWSYNALRFPSKKACLNYGGHLYQRWTGLHSYEAHPSDDEPNRKED